MLKLKTFHKGEIQIFLSILSFYIFYLATSPAAYILRNLVFRNWCYSFMRNVTEWLHILLIILSNDIHLNPGPPFHNSCFTFMSWNVNSIAKENF